MVVSMYQHYLWMIGKLKDSHKMTIVVPHKDSHEMCIDNQPKFKLLFGEFAGHVGECIVFCPHVYLEIKEAIIWFSRVAALHPELLLWDVYLEDDRGEYFLGNDAYDVQNLFEQKATLEHWLENSDEVGIAEFVNSKTYGRVRDPKKLYDSTVQKNLAMDEFLRIRKPDSDDEVQ